MLKNLVMNFIRDERGAESSEVGVTSVVIAGGAIRGTEDFRDAIKVKQDLIVAEIGSIGTGD
jgi:Flp pilus assembly pilin Flp